jgi:subtilase family serine protease
MESTVGGGERIGSRGALEAAERRGESYMRGIQKFVILLALLGALITEVVGVGSAGAASSGDFTYRVTPHWVSIGSTVSAFTNPFCSSHRLICYSPNDIRKAYDYPAGLDGAGQTIVIVDAFGSPTIQNDLATFDARFGLSAPPSFRVICPEGCPAFDPTDVKHDEVGWAFETSLDVEWAHAMAPGANIVLAVASTSSGNALNVTENAVISRYPGSIMSQSFGIPEALVHNNNAQIIQAEKNYIAARNAGITALASAGDFGATNGGASENAGYPSSDPNVTAVGGTQGDPYFNGRDPNGTAPPNCALNVPCTVGLATVRCSSSTVCPTISYGGEQVWNEPFFGVAGGGAASLLFSAPSYQAGDGTGSAARTTPDISYNAAISGGVLVSVSFPTVGPGFYIVGGTSAGSPQMAAVVALANEQRQLKSEDNLGFLNDRLYATAEGANYGSDFHDITVGNNQVAGTPFGYSSGAGYDIATGWGTPDVANLVVDLAK